MSTYTPPTSMNGHTSDADTGERMTPPAPAADKDRSWHEWMMIAVGLTALLAIMAIIISVVALASKSSTGGTSTQLASAAPAPALAAAPLAPPQSITISVKSDSEHGRLGPDSKWHDAFVPADFGVRAGSTVTVTVYNYDNGPHTFTSPSMGVNAIIPGGNGLNAPHQMTFTFKAPTHPGKYAWWCAVPCDPWAMAHDGYMRGYVTVKA